MGGYCFGGEGAVVVAVAVDVHVYPADFGNTKIMNPANPATAAPSTAIPVAPSGEIFVWCFVCSC